MRRMQMIGLVSLLCSLIAALAGPHLSGLPLAQAGAEAAGYSDFAYKYAGVTTPTADKPQSKLWFNDGIWWASMFNNTNSPRPAYHIYRLNLASQTWVDTGVEIDERSSSQGDFLWNGDTGKLYVVSGSPLVDGRFLRYGYDPGLKKYTREIGPVVVRKNGGESISLDRDSAGRLWVTFTQNSQVYVNHSLGDDATWATPFVIPGARALDLDDISAIVSYRESAGGRIGVLWSNHVSTPAMYFAYHRDGDPPGSWQTIETIYSGKCTADDHISIKSLQADPSGSLFAAVKTSFGDSGCTGGSLPQIRLVVRKPNGSWATATFGTVSDQHTRPIVLLDTTNRKVYVFATSPTSCGTIYMKSTSMDTLSFPTGPGTPFIKSSTYTCINNATSTKQALNANSGLVVLAADESKGWYMHNTLSLGTPQPRLAFTREPAGAEIGRAFATQPIVTALTSQGQVDASFNGLVTLAIKAGTGTSGAALTGTITRNAVNGIASFNDLSINVAGSGYQLSASAAGYASASSFLFDVTKISQTIAVAPIPQQRYGDPPVSVEAVAYVSGTSQPTGLPLSYVDVNANDACQVSGGQVQIVGVGTCTVRASQSGNNTYAPAVADESFTVQKAVQSISFQLPVKHYGDPPFAISATASSGLKVSFSASGACRVKNNVVTLTGPDFCTIQASQAGNTYYFAAPNVSRTISPYYYVYAPLSRR